MSSIQLPEDLARHAESLVQAEGWEQICAVDKYRERIGNLCRRFIVEIEGLEVNEVRANEFVNMAVKAVVLLQIIRRREEIRAQFKQELGEIIDEAKNALEIGDKPVDTTAIVAIDDRPAHEPSN